MSSFTKKTIQKRTNVLIIWICFYFVYTSSTIEPTTHQTKEKLFFSFFFSLTLSLSLIFSCIHVFDRYDRACARAQCFICLFVVIPCMPCNIRISVRAYQYMCPKDLYTNQIQWNTKSRMLISLLLFFSSNINAGLFLFPLPSLFLVRNWFV